MPRRQPEYRAGRSHHDFLVNLAVSRRALEDAFRTTFSPGPSTPLPTPPVQPDLLQSLLVEKYANPEWIERF
jgi:lipoate---protein ligase